MFKRGLERESSKAPALDATKKYAKRTESDAIEIARTGEDSPLGFSRCCMVDSEVSGP